MGKRKVSVLETAATALADASFFIVSKGMPATAKKFVYDIIIFFKTLADTKIEHRKCIYKRWHALGYNCINYKKFNDYPQLSAKEN